MGVAEASKRATIVGAAAIPMWALLALLTLAIGRIPPLQALAMGFAVGFVLTCIVWLVRGTRLGFARYMPAGAWLLGIGGLFGYHLLYFLAFRAAPAAEVNLLNYLWPLLIVLFSARLPGQRLSPLHIAGAVAGFAGTALLIGPGLLQLGSDSGDVWGYLFALAAACIWAGYSVLSRRVAEVPSDAVGLFCGATALLAFLLHLLVEPVTMLPTGAEALALLALGSLPLGAAFFFWDHGVKHGEIQLLGALAYATPLLSTLLLAVAGETSLSPRIWAACGLIVGGAVLAGRAGRRRAAKSAVLTG
jgi:drug/metabolite transporter (DMT)-like permease